MILTQKLRACDFCETPETTAFLLIAAPRDIFICDKCVGLCNEVIAEQTPKLAATTGIAIAGIDDLRVPTRPANSPAEIGVNLFKALRGTAPESSSCPEEKSQSEAHPRQASTPQGAQWLRLIALGIFVAATVAVLPRGRQS